MIQDKYKKQIQEVLNEWLGGLNYGCGGNGKED
jgi:hypothetical protein